jgi:hypothetical protein
MWIIRTFMFTVIVQATKTERQRLIKKLKIPRKNARISVKHNTFPPLSCIHRNVFH